MAPAQLGGVAAGPGPALPAAPAPHPPHLHGAVDALADGVVEGLDVGAGEVALGGSAPRRPQPVRVRAGARHAARSSSREAARAGNAACRARAAPPAPPRACARPLSPAAPGPRPSLRPPPAPQPSPARAATSAPRVTHVPGAWTPLPIAPCRFPNRPAVPLLPPVPGQRGGEAKPPHVQSGGKQPQAPTRSVPWGFDTPVTRCPKDTPQAAGFACFNDGLGEMWIDVSSPESRELRRSPAPHAHAGVRAAGHTIPASGNAPHTSSHQRQGFPRAATADTVMEHGYERHSDALLAESCVWRTRNAGSRDMQAVLKGAGHSHRDEISA